MTEFDIQESLFRRFMQLNEFSGIGYLHYDGDGNCTNVHLPNAPFSVPDDKRWFDLTFRSGEPEAAALMDGSQNRYSGVLYVDIMTPQDSGEEEARAKYEQIARLFTRDMFFDDVAVMRCYVSTKGNDDGCYRLQAAVEWEADIDKE